MCQPVSGTFVKLKKTRAWKVVNRDGRGPHYWPDYVNYRKTWNDYSVFTARPEAEGQRTISGIHVYKSRKSARAYRDSYRSCTVIEVIVWGHAIPFKGADGEGWAVQYARRRRKGEPLPKAHKRAR